MHRDPLSEKPSEEQAAEPAAESDDQAQPTEPGQIAPPSPPPAETAPALPEYYAAGVAATGLTAVLVAIMSSQFGLQGTIAGAFLGAVAMSVVSQQLRKPLSRLEGQVVAAGAAIKRLPWGEPGRLSQEGRAQLTRQVPRATLVSVLALGLGGFLLGIFGISLFEAAKGRPLSAISSGEGQRGTTIGLVVQEVVEDLPRAPATPPGQVVGAPSPVEMVGSPTAAPATSSPAPVAPLGTPAPLPTPAPATPTAGPSVVAVPSPSHPLAASPSSPTSTPRRVVTSTPTRTPTPTPRLAPIVAPATVTPLPSHAPRLQ